MSFAGKFHPRPYLEQFDRIKRWHKILNKFRYSNSDENYTDYQVDCIYVFFTNCYHLKDWLIHSKVISKNKLNKFIDENKEMRICRDMCNGIKHLSLTNPSIGKDVRCNCGFHGVFLQREYDPFQKVLKNNNPIKNITYVVFVEYEKYNVFSLADKCVELWEKFFKENSIL